MTRTMARLADRLIAEIVPHVDASAACPSVLRFCYCKVGVWNTLDLYMKEYIRCPGYPDILIRCSYWGRCR